MIRPFRDEIARYGEYSKAGEFVYDHPFQWGSKRTGPDLARIGGKYPDSWHYNHMRESQSISPGSIMPNYPWLLDDVIDTTLTPKMIRAMTALGVPYEPGYDLKANEDLMAQGNAITANLAKDKLQTIPTSEIVALIAYLQRMGTDIKNLAPKPILTTEEPVKE
jgi:cytochrome c oxidase cbb3-type subunit I/II